jgi:hypothetical protein
MILVIKRLSGQLALVGAVTAAVIAAMALLTTAAEAHHGDFYASADCYGWKVTGKYVGDEDRRVDVDVTINGEHIVSSDTGYQTGDVLFERAGTGSVDAVGKIKVYYKSHGEWKLEAKDKLDFHFDWAPCETPTSSPTPESTPSATPTPGATPSPTAEATPSPTAEATPSPTPESSPTPEVSPTPESSPTPEGTPEGTPESTPETTPVVTPPSTPEVGSDVLGVSTGPRALPAGGANQSSGGADSLAAIAGGLALLAGAATIATVTARSRRG